MTHVEVQADAKHAKGLDDSATQALALLSPSNQRAAFAQLPVFAANAEAPGRRSWQVELVTDLLR